MTLTFFALPTLIAYLAAAILSALRAVRPLEVAPFWYGRPLVGVVAGLAILGHGAALAELLFVDDGLALDIGNVVGIVGLVVAAIMLLASMRLPVDSLGTVLYPAAATGLAAAVLLPTPTAVAAAMPWELRAHVLLSVAAYGLLSVAAAQAVLLAVQERRLRRRRPTGLTRLLPPLEIMERLLFQMLASGFALLTLSLFSGLFFVEDLFAQHLVHKTILSILAWLVFGVLVWGRYRFGWRGRTAIRWTLGGFVLLALAYFGSRMVLELILGQRWG